MEIHTEESSTVEHISSVSIRRWCFARGFARRLTAIWFALSLTQATDTSNIRLVFAAVKVTILQVGLTNFQTNRCNFFPQLSLWHHSCLSECTKRLRHHVKPLSIRWHVLHPYLPPLGKSDVRVRFPQTPIFPLSCGVAGVPMKPDQCFVYW